MLRNAKALQYYSADHLLQRVNPLAKFIVIISLSLVIFISHSTWIHAGIFFFTAAWFFFIPFSFFQFQGAKVMIVTTIFIGLLQVVFVKNGAILVDLPFIKITESGIIQAISASSRFITIIMLSYLFVLSTDPGKFVQSLVGLGLPYRFGYTLITALRMIPLVKAEVEKIIFAQITRGVRYKLFPLKKLTTSVGQFLKVVMIALLKRVNQLVISMEGRSFGLYAARSSMSSVTYQWTDYLIISVSIVLIPIAVLCS